MLKENANRLFNHQAIISDLVVMDIEIVLSYLICLHDPMKNPIAALTLTKKRDRQVHDMAVAVRDYLCCQLDRCHCCNELWDEVYSERVRHILDSNRLHDIFFGLEGYTDEDRHRGK